MSLPGHFFAYLRAIRDVRGRGEPLIHPPEDRGIQQMAIPIIYQLAIGISLWVSTSSFLVAHIPENTLSPLEALLLPPACEIIGYLGYLGIRGYLRMARF